MTNSHQSISAGSCDVIRRKAQHFADHWRAMLPSEIEWDNSHIEIVISELQGIADSLALIPDVAQGAQVRDERAAFIAAHRHLDLTEIKDAWGAPMFQHSHVDAMWSGWKAHVLSIAAQPPAAPVEMSQMHLDAAFDKGREYGLLLARSSAGTGSAGILSEIADWIESQRKDFEASIACNDPALKKHQEWLRSCEKALRTINEPQEVPKRCPATRQVFEIVIGALNYDGRDIDSLTVGEIRRALP